MTIDCSKLTPGTICVTQSGREVEFIGTISVDKHSVQRDIFSYVFFSDWYGLHHRNLTGMYEAEKSDCDIISIKKPKRVLDCWVNVYPDIDPIGFSSKEEADWDASPDDGRPDRRIACLHIVQEYEEGEGL